MSNNSTACRCDRCNRVLKNEEAIQVGMGATCYRKTYGKTIKQALKEEAMKQMFEDAPEDETEVEGKAQEEPLEAQ